ncbi:MAG: alpha amylase C-terminal domain-containing protein [Bacteroidia bacterium]|nr:alpha amylase C-terminal domain-containing protein [Bacteroidia bacterium]
MKAEEKKKKVPGLIADDPWLEPYTEDIEYRLDRFKSALKEISDATGSLREFSMAYLQMGIHYDPMAQGWRYREWAPRAEALFLIGDFNGWNRSSHPLQKGENGIWEIFIPDDSPEGKLTVGSKVKVHVVGINGTLDRIPAYIFRAVQDEKTTDFAGEVVDLKKSFPWTDQYYNPTKIDSPLIYECHTGMAQEKEGLGTYREFADLILPRISRQGYNVIQLMAVQEHPYYGSFGYHVSSFFAPSSRFGTADDLKYMINRAHELDIAVIMDVVHSHAVKNLAEGLNEFDGSDDQYFHPGGRGYHTGWDSKLFNYGKWEVRQFLLSNLAYWLTEFHFDGFRFDGVTSMLYFHHGDYVAFGHYDKYFREGVEWDSITYLQLANELVHSLKPGAITVAEDMSGMPGGCRPVYDGGLGFDYRLGMGIPDYWIKILKHKRDEEWNIHEMWHVLTNRRFKEKTIAYAESHDQALVGDKTLAFWLMDQEMYWHMQVDDENPVIDRGVALHKMLRLFTAALGGEGYLNFMGNEFGHPEWIDFPRQGNNWSYKYARRQWSLVDNHDLKYKYLNIFDRALVGLLKDHYILSSMPAQPLNMDENNQVVVFERNNRVFVFNFHPTRSIPDYEFTVPEKGPYTIILNTDSPVFGGHKRVDDTLEYPTMKDEYGNFRLRLYCTNRTALVLKSK